MPRPVEDIVALYQHRKKERGPVLARMAELAEAYNGELVVPLPELDRNEKVAVANLTAQGIDQMGTRIASVMPDVFFPPKRQGFKVHEDRARDKRKATFSWFQENALDLKMYRRARWLVGYASAPVVIKPNSKTRIPTWRLRSPLQSFPAPVNDPDDVVPDDSIFTFTRTLAWIQANYPDKIGNLELGRNPSPDQLHTLLEYIDADEHVMVVLGAAGEPHVQTNKDAFAVLDRAPNLAGRCTAIVPGRITLDKPQGQFDGMIGMYQQQAKLFALEVIAVEKGIFPDTYLVSHQGRTASIVQQADGIHGEVGIVKDGDLKDVTQNPTYLANVTISNLERAQRLTAGIPAEFGGESTTNVRTGKRGDAILSAVVDFPVQEAHRVFARSLHEEIRTAIAVAKGYYGNEGRSFFVSWQKERGQVDYTPDELFDTDFNHVSYAQAGADINNLVIGVGQRVGIGTMSKRTAQEIDPLIEDPEKEHDRVISEGLEAALLASVQQQVNEGVISAADMAEISIAVKSNKVELAEAIVEMQKKAQERQATPAPPGSPETQPGLAPAETAGAEQPSIEEPSASVQNLAQLMGGLRRPQMTIASERG